jgi:hypothetical protein
MAKRQITPYRPIYPSPAALITSADLNGTANIITLVAVRTQVEIISINLKPLD